jgi:hypothetical protein
VLLHIGVARPRQPVDDDLGGGRALGTAVGADRDLHPVPERRVQIPLEQIGRLHDVHVGVDEPQAVFHDTLPF